MFGVVVFGLHQDLRFVYLDQQLEDCLMATGAQDEGVASLPSKRRRAEFCFLPLLVLYETYQLGLDDRLLNITSDTLSVELAEQDALTVILIRGPNVRISMDTVKAVLHLCFGTLLAVLSLDRLQEQSWIAEQLLQALYSAESPPEFNAKEADMLVSVIAGEGDSTNERHVTTAKILLLFLKLFFVDSLDGVVYVEQEHRMNFYGGRRWNSCMLFLLLRLSYLIDDQSSPSRRISAFVQIDGDDSFTAVDVYFYRLSASVCLFGIVRMMHSNLLALLSRHFMELELARANAYEDLAFHSLGLAERQKAFLRRLKVEMKKCKKDIHLSQLQLAIYDVNRMVQRKRKVEDGALISSMRKVSCILRDMLESIYTTCHGRVERSSLDLFNVCCESLLCAPQVGHRQIGKCVFERIFKATGPLASALDLDAEAYVFGVTNGDLRLQAGSAEIVERMLNIRFDKLSAKLCCFRCRQYVYILIKRTAKQEDGRLKKSSFKKLVQIARRGVAARKGEGTLEGDSTFVIAAYAAFVNLSLAVWQTMYLAERLRGLLEQSWHFHRVVKE
uniref:Uncharacterized protein n=1 Tax=Trichuris muris TaxID=70415 RepID=A0A5S6R4Q1_TRIMR